MRQGTVMKCDTGPKKTKTKIRLHYRSTMLVVDLKCPRSDKLRAIKKNNFFFKKKVFQEKERK